jgi:hypothetical protein
MLTIKHIHIGGDEDVISAFSTRYAPGSQYVGGQGAPGTPATLWYRKAEFEPEQPLTGGTIFVMNAKGSTVARYDLGASPVPRGADAGATSMLSGIAHRSDCAIHNGPALPGAPCDCFQGIAA